MTKFAGLVMPTASEPDTQILAVAFRTVRQGSGLGLEEFARKADLPLRLLGQIEDGRTLPSRDVLHGYLSVCAEERDRHIVRDLWERVHRVEQHSRLLPYPTGGSVENRRPAATTPAPARRRPRTRSGVDPTMWPPPKTIATPEQYASGLAAIKRSSAMSYTDIAEESRKRGYPLARSSIHTLCTKAKLPSSPLPVREFVLVCGGTEADADAWHLAWLRLSMTEGGHRDQQAVHVLDDDLAPADTATVGVTSPTESDLGGIENDVVDSTIRTGGMGLSDDSVSPPVATVTSAAESDTTTFTAVAVSGVGWWAKSIDVRVGVSIGLVMFATGLVLGAVLAP